MDSTTPNMFSYSTFLYDYGIDFDYESYINTVVFVILIIVSVLSVIGNILVVLISGFYMRLRSLTSIFILNLALSDLLFTVGPLFWISNYISGWLSKYLECRVVEFVSATGFYTSMVLLVLMNIQNYMVTVHTYSGWKKRRCVTLIFVCAWMVGVIAALPESVHMDFLPALRFCFYSSTTTVSNVFRMNIFFLCASVIMCFCSIRILQTIIKSRTKRIKKHRSTVLVLPLAATFFICWAPYNILFFFAILNKYWFSLDWGTIEKAMFIVTPLAFCQCCINPIIFGSFGLKFRKESFQRRDTLNTTNMVELNN